MPKLMVNGVEIHYEVAGTGSETIVFAHGLLWSGAMFAAQVAALQKRYRCITFDFRGQGQSAVTAVGYDMDSLTEDAWGVIKSLNAAPCHFVGLSMGGFVGMRLAIRYPELLKSLILLETSADPEPVENISNYKKLNFVARWLGLRLVANQVLPIMFGKTFLHDPARAVEREHWKQRLIENHRIGITRAVVGVIEREGVYEQLPQIKTPTLVVVGDEDVATVPEKSRRIQSQIAGSKLVTIPKAGHSSVIEEKTAVNQAILSFLNPLES
jgi:pimeloyl-ACP methyl ester carboxylesterase